MRGTLPENDPHFSRLDIYLVKGTADIQFDLSDLAIDRKKTDYLDKVLFLSYSGRKKFLVDVDIAIEPGDIRLVESVDAREYTKDEMKKMAGTVAVAAGVGYVFTDNFVGALQAKAKGDSEVMEMIAAAQPLIVMELVGEDRLGSPDWENETRSYYRSRFEGQMRSISRRFGWNGLVIDYGSGK